jgi:DNA-binding transcriptional ArsR family regulator
MPVSLAAAPPREDFALNGNRSHPTRPLARNAAASSPPRGLASETLARLARLFNLLSDESRLRMVLTLSRTGQADVSALAALVGLSEKAVSHHLTVMRLAGLISHHRSGKKYLYRLESGHVPGLLERVLADTDNGQELLQLGGFTLTYRRGR